MAVGTLLFRRLRANCVVTVEKGNPNPAGGTQITWSTVASGVDVVVSNLQGVRDTAGGTLGFRGTCSVSGRDPSLARPDVRLKVTAAAPGLTWLVGLYLSITGGQTHPRGGAGLVQERVGLSCTILELPSTRDGSEL